MPESFQRAAVIGSGSFGTSLAKLLAYNVDVLIFSRKMEVVHQINHHHRHFDVQLDQRIRATADLEEIVSTCQVLFPVIPSEHFRSVMRALSPYVRPFHIMIHGTKGLDLGGLETKNTLQRLTKLDVLTMSEVIEQETSVIQSILADFTNRAELAAAVAALGLNAWVAYLGAVNTEFDQVYVQRSQQTAGDPSKVLDLRAAVTAAWETLKQHITAHATLTPTPALTKTVSEMNRLIEDYNKSVAGRGGAAPEEPQAPADPEPTPA